jgi:hypothetical protein
MKQLILLFLTVISTCGCAEQPIFSPEDIAGWKFKAGNGTIISDAVLVKRVLNGRTWHLVYSTGLLFTMSPDAEGNMELTWDPIIYMKDNETPKSFILYYKNPTPGLSWNPDGVEIKIDKIDEDYKFERRNFIVDEYGFYRDGSEVARVWLSKTDGILRVDRMVYGVNHSLFRILE